MRALAYHGPGPRAWVEVPKRPSDTDRIVGSTQ